MITWKQKTRVNRNQNSDPRCQDPKLTKIRKFNQGSNPRPYCQRSTFPPLHQSVLTSIAVPDGPMWDTPIDKIYICDKHYPTREEKKRVPRGFLVGCRKNRGRTLGFEAYPKPSAPSTNNTPCIQPIDDDCGTFALFDTSVITPAFLAANPHVLVIVHQDPSTGQDSFEGGYKAGLSK